MSSPAIGADGTIYVGSDKLYAINPNGTKKWAYATGDYINSSPAIGADGKIYVGSNDRNLYAINPDGTQKWVIATGGPIASSPAIGADGTVYVGSDDKKLYAIGNKAATFTVTPTAGINGTISPNTPQTVTANGNLTLTATANAGYTVDAWQLDTITVQTGGLTYMLKNVTANHTVKVTFKPLTVTLTPSTDANGTITPNTAQTANYGNSVTFTAKPNAGYQVDYWKCNGAIVFNGGKVANGAYTGLTFTIIPISSSTVNVAFTAVNYTITPSAGANGAISTNIPQLAKYGCKLIFTAKPNTGYRVDYWKFNGALVYNAGKAANGAYTGSTLTLTVISNSTVYVAFTAMNYTITPSAGPNGSIIPKSTQTVSNGSSVSFTATANAGYTVDSWTLDGAVVQTGGNQYTLKTIFANHAVKVTFKLRTFLITPSGGSGGVITPPTPQMVNYAGNITFIATAYAGFTVDCWTLDGVTIQVGGSSYTLKTVTFAHTVMVKFISTNKNQPDLTICNNGDTTYMGWNILNVTGSNQTTMQSVANGVAATYLWRVENHGYTSDSFLLTCPLPALSGWTVQVIDRVTNKDITAAITGAGYTSVTLAPGVAGGFTLKVTLTSTALSGKAYALLITGVSVKDNTKKDAVKAVTTKQ